MADDKKTFEQLQAETMEAVSHLREKADAYGVDSAEHKQALENIEGKLEEYDEREQKLVKDMAAERKAAEEKSDEFKDRLEAMEKELVSGGSGNKKDYKQSGEYKALTDFTRKGFEGMSPESKALLRGDDATQGGYLTMPEMDDMIIKEITEISPVRSVARVKTVGSKTLMIPTRDSIPTALYEGEADQDNESTSTYGSETLTTFALSVTVPFTRDVMMDSEFDLENEIRMDVAEAYAFAEGRNFVLGDGAKKPEGFLSHPDLIQAFNASTNPVGYRQSETSATVTFDDLANLTGDLKVGYMPMFTFNRRTKANLLTQKGSDGQYLWTMARDGAPSSIFGYNYVLFEDMPDIASNAFSIAFGDFMRGYCITDFSGMEVVRDEVTRKRNRIIELTFFRWNTGQVILSEAIKLLRIQ